MTAPDWLESALARCWLCCPGCGPVSLSLRFGPVEPDAAPEDSAWDWNEVIHHARDDCRVLADEAAMYDLGAGLKAELAGHVVVADYCEPLPWHTAEALAL